MVRVKAYSCYSTSLARGMSLRKASVHLLMVSQEGALKALEKKQDIPEGARVSGIIARFGESTDRSSRRMATARILR